MSYASFLPFLFLLVWVTLVVYGFVLATRLVRAVEQIAASTTQRPPDSPRV